MSKRMPWCGVLALAVVCGVAQAETVRLSVDRYLDKCKGAWVGQMIGVCYGAPTEFKSNGKPIAEPIRDWTPGEIKGAIGQDDCYVEMTFLKALEDHGIDISFEQAGKAFGESKYDLWHANRAGRDNVRKGIMPPLSGYPTFNRHADDIDFQIEADLFGILCPGLPDESNRLCDVFGHIMNYGDGVYGGMFMAGMYVAAYFEDEDVNKVIAAGLACIPEASTYRQCIADVVRWHQENPNDWLATWKKIEEKWQDDLDCGPGNPFNIDAKLNGAYVVVGLLYGNGDLAKTIEIAARCGQDSDCNPSNAAGILGCMKGFAVLGDHWTDGLDEVVDGVKIADTKFAYTDYSFNTLIPACRRITEAVVRRAGGQVSDTEYTIPRQMPRPPETFEQWVDQKRSLAIPLTTSEIQTWNPAWKVVACGADMEPGVRPHQYGRENVLLIHPVSEKKPAVLAAKLAVPATSHPTLKIDVASDERGDFVLKVFVDDKPAKETVVNTKGRWTTVDVDLTPYAGKSVPVRIENHANGWSYEAAYLGKVRLD